MKPEKSPDLRTVEKRAFRINDFCSAYGLGRSKTYELIKSGRLRTVMVGGRRRAGPMSPKPY